MANLSASAVALPARRTRFRWIVLLIVCLFHVVNFADRANIGVVIPALKTEFSISNFELGAMASIFFLGYLIVQIPAGFFISRFGNRGFVSLSIIGFSSMTYLIGTAPTAAMVKWYRFALGIFEAPTPVGSTTTVKNWFPPKERGTALGILTGSTTSAVMLTPPIAAWIMMNYGWRYVFYYFALPGFVLSVFWYLFIRRTPRESPYCSPGEADYIQTAEKADERGPREPSGWLGWLDGFIRAKKVIPIETTAGVFTSKNILGIALVYFFMQVVFYGLLTWIPSYLVTTKGYSIMKMGWVSASPWLGGILGNVFGGVLSDRLLLGRRKPMMLFSGLSTLIGMWALIHVPNDTAILAVTLLLTGFALNSSWSSYLAFPMGLTTGTTYPLAISVMITGGNIGAFISPMTAGYLLDVFKNYDVVFMFMGLCAILSFLVVLPLDEPV